MPRIRSIKPEFPHSESMGRVSRDARLLFLQLFTLADDDGRLRGTPELLAGLLYPYDVVERDAVIAGIAEWLAELEREDCVVCYTVGRAHYIAVTHFREHQRIDKPTKSKLPAPPLANPREASRTLASPRESSRGLHDGSGSGSGSGEEGKREDGDTPAAPVSPSDPPHDRGGAAVLLPSDTESLLAHWRAVGEQHGVLEPAATSPKVEHQARELLALHSLDVLRQAATAFWASEEFAAKRHFGMFHRYAGQLVAHVRAGHGHPFGARARALEVRPRPARAGYGPNNPDPCQHDPPCTTYLEHQRRWLDEARAREGLPPRSPSAARATSGLPPVAVA